MISIAHVRQLTVSLLNAVSFLQLGLPSTLIRHKNGASFLQLGLPSTLIRHEKWSVENALETAGI